MKVGLVLILNIRAGSNQFFNLLNEKEYEKDIFRIVYADIALYIL